MARGAEDGEDGLGCEGGRLWMMVGEAVWILGNLLFVCFSKC